MQGVEPTVVSPAAISLTFVIHRINDDICDRFHSPGYGRVERHVNDRINDRKAAH